MLTALFLVSFALVGFLVTEVFEDDDDPVGDLDDLFPEDPNPPEDPEEPEDPEDPEETDDDVLSANGTDIVSGGPGDDTLTSSDMASIFGDAGDDSLTVEDEGFAEGGPGDDVLIAQGMGELSGGPGDDTLTGLDGGDLIGGPGDDALSVENGSARGFSGDDTIEGVNSKLNGDAGNDRLTGVSNSEVSGGDGNDEIFVGDSSEGRGGAGDDRVIGRAPTVKDADAPDPIRTVLEGNTGSDFVQGNTGVDIIGGQNSSVLQAVIGQGDYYGVTNAPDGTVPTELGAARMTGFADADQFEVKIDDLTDRSDDIWSDPDLDIISIFDDDPIVVIRDFMPGEDTLLIDSEDPEEVTFAGDGEGGTLIVLDFGTAANNRGDDEQIEVTIRLQNVTPDELSDDAVVFGTSTA